MVQLFLTRLAVKRLFKFSPHPTYSSALPGEIKTHEIGIKINKKNAKKTSVTLLMIILMIIGKDNGILIVFDVNISDITGHQMAIHIPSSPVVCCCITWGNRTKATRDRKTKNISKFNHFRYVALNSPDHSSFDSICSAMQQRVYGTQEATGRSLKQNIINTALTQPESISLLVLTQMASISNICCCTAGQIDKTVSQSARNLDKMCQTCVI